MQSKARTVDEYLAELPPDRKSAIAAVRKMMKASLDPRVQEGMQYGMIGFYIPHTVFPAGYHCDPKQPLPFAALASQKNYMSVYLMSIYGEGAEEHWFREQWAKTGKKLDMGKCCIRFRKLEDLAVDVVAESIRRVSVDDYLGHYIATTGHGAEYSPSGAVARAQGNPRATAPGVPKRKSATKSATKAATKSAANATPESRVAAKKAGSADAPTKRARTPVKRSARK